MDAFRQLVFLNPRRGRDAPVGRFLLSIALRELFDATNDVSVLQEAVEVGVAAAKVMPPDQSSYATGGLNLAIALRDLGQRIRNGALVDDAIGYGRWRAGTLTPDHPLRPDAFCDLSMALHARYELTGDMNALREAISVGWQALEIVPQGHAQHVSAPYRLTEYLDQLYGKTHDPAALDDAIKVSRWGVQISASTVWEILKASGVDPARRSGRVGLTCITKNGSDGSSSPSATRRAPFTVHLRLPSNHKSCYTAGGATLEGKDGQDETGHISVAVRYSK